MHTDRTVESLLHIVLIVMAYRFRNVDDFNYVIGLINEELQKGGTEISDISTLHYPTLTIENDKLRIGQIQTQMSDYDCDDQQCLVGDMPFLEAALFSVENSVPCLFTTTQQNVSTADRVVYEISNLCKQKVHTISLAQSTDTTDLIGQFEQFSMQSIILDFHSKF